MTLQRWDELRSRLSNLTAGAPRPLSPWMQEHGRELLTAALCSRELDRVALNLARTGDGLYTICNAGHEPSALLGVLTAPTDPALLHYRDAAFLAARAARFDAPTFPRDLVASLVGSREEPVAGGRHKVLGSLPLGILPQTSTIASHLPRALGLAFAIQQRAWLPPQPSPLPLGPKSIVVASFGDGAWNHSVLQGTIQAAGWFQEQGMPLPLLLVCEDNDWAISVRTPPQWLEKCASQRTHLRYFSANGSNWEASAQAALGAVSWCRRQRRPALLHLKVPRLFPHAGSDQDTTYRTAEEIAAALDRDPLCHLAQLLLDARLLSERALHDECVHVTEQFRHAVDATCPPRHLLSRQDVVTSLAPPAPLPRPVAPTSPLVDPVEGPASPQLTLAGGLRASLSELLRVDEGATIFGEDVGKKGGVYGITRTLQESYGVRRVHSTLLDETTILGLALGQGTLGLLPVPEIEYLAYLHNAIDQLRGEAATLRYFTNGAASNPMLLRIAGFAGPKGVGGHFHNENSLAALRDIPGIVVAVPTRADDAAALVAAAHDLCRKEGRIVVLVEPASLYFEKDLHEPGDGAWLAEAHWSPARWLEPRTYGPEAPELLLVSYGPGVPWALRTQRKLESEGHRVRTVDLRWIHPWPESALLRELANVDRVLLIEPCRRAGNVMEAIASRLAESPRPPRLALRAAADCWNPIGPAAALMLPSLGELHDAALGLLAHPIEPRRDQ